MFTLSRRPLIRGGTLAPVIIIIVALALSAAVFFLFTKKRIEANREAEAAAAAENEAAGSISQQSEETTPTPPQKGKAPPSAAAARKPMRAPADEDAETKSTTAPQTFAFTNPAEVADQLTRHLAAGDLVGAAKLIAAGH